MRLDFGAVTSKRTSIRLVTLLIGLLALVARASDPDVDRLIELFKSTESPINTFGEISALQARIAQRGPEVVPALLERARDPDQKIRGQMIALLGEIGDPRSLDALILALDDTSWLIQASAARGLGKLKDARAVDPLMKKAMPGGARDDVRVEALLALGKTGEPRVAIFLVRIIQNDWNINVKDAAVQGFQAMTGQSFGFDARSYIQWLNNNHPDWVEMGGSRGLPAGFRWIIWSIVLFAVIGFGAIIRSW